MSPCFSYCLFSQPLSKRFLPGAHDYLNLCAFFWIIPPYRRGYSVPRGVDSVSVLTHFFHESLLLALASLPSSTSCLKSVDQNSSKTWRWNLLLTVAVEAEDAFLQSVQGHEADVLKHIQTGAATWGQVLPLGLCRKRRGIITSWDISQSTVTTTRTDTQHQPPIFPGLTRVDTWPQSLPVMSGSETVMSDTRPKNGDQKPCVVKPQLWLPCSVHHQSAHLLSSVSLDMSSATRWSDRIG